PSHLSLSHTSLDIRFQHPSPSRLPLSPHLFFLLIIPPPPRSTLFPYTTLFRSSAKCNKHKPSTHKKSIPCDKRNARARGHMNNKDRKSTRLNSSHVSISYAVFCLKKKKKKKTDQTNDTTKHQNNVITKTELSTN